MGKAFSCDICKQFDEIEQKIVVNMTKYGSSSYEFDMCIKCLKEKFSQFENRFGERDDCSRIDRIPNVPIIAQKKGWLKL